MVIRRIQKGEKDNKHTVEVYLDGEKVAEQVVNKIFKSVRLQGV